VYTNTPFDLQTIVHLSINGVTLPPLEGRVVWCGPPGNDPDAPKGVQYRVGIDFMPKDDDARENQLATYQKMLEIAEGIARK
jgi:Tfp pilus assembly protein PilZ